MRTTTLPDAFQAALRLAAREVVEDALDLRGALLLAQAQSRARRHQDRLTLWHALPAAVLDHQSLFANAGFAQRQQQSALAAAAAAQRFQPWHPLLLGAAAVGLPADDDCVELALHLDEDEELLRLLFEQQIRTRVSERLLSQRAGSPERRCTTITYAERTSDVELVLLPLSWRGRPLFVDGLPLTKAAPEAAPWPRP
ncbi:MAG: hypothetical protein KDI48_05745 [Xanthomonadales bacterium]|nr:hypothetical protein [Xanthomonadales bacterium]